jgi:hypothetical protein
MTPLSCQSLCRDIGACVGSLQESFAVVMTGVRCFMTFHTASVHSIAADIAILTGGGAAGGSAATKHWQMKLLPSCSSLCLSNLFGSLSVKDQFPLEIKASYRGCGAGVFAACDVPQGAAVCCYLGEIVSDYEMNMREGVGNQRNHTVELDSYYKCWSHLKIKGRHSFIDADRCGNTGRFINHGCGNSANLITCIVEQHSHSAVIGLIASRDIPKGQELRWNYFSGKDGIEKKNLMWWGDCFCPDCVSENSGSTQRRRSLEPDST